MSPKVIWNAHNSSSGLSTLVVEDLRLSWTVLMKSQRPKKLLSTYWSYITLLNFVKLSTLLIENGKHNRYATLTTLALVWALCSFSIFFRLELRWWPLKEGNSCCLKVDRIIRCLTLLNWALLMENGSHKQYYTLTTLGVVRALFPFRIFCWSELCWWVLPERHCCCLQFDRILSSSAFLDWAVCWSRRVTISDMQRLQL